MKGTALTLPPRWVFYLRPVQIWGTESGVILNLFVNSKRRFKITKRKCIISEETELSQLQSTNHFKIGSLKQYKCLWNASFCHSMASPLLLQQRKFWEDKFLLNKKKLGLNNNLFLKMRLLKLKIFVDIFNDNSCRSFFMQWMWSCIGILFIL